MTSTDLTAPPGVKVDILVRSGSWSETLKECLASLHTNTHRDLYRLTLVDDGSNPPIEVNADLLIRNKVAKGKIASTNQGMVLAMQDSDAPYLLLLSPNTRIPTGDMNWLFRMMVELEEGGPQCAAVGATTGFANPPQHILTVPQTYTQAWQDADGKRGGMSENPAVPWFSGFCVLLRKSAVMACGFFDPQYDSGGFEDMDYALQLRTAGYTVRVARSVYIHHIEHKTLLEESQEMASQNQRKWVSKWGIGRLFDLGAVPPEHLKAALAAAR